MNIYGISKVVTGGSKGQFVVKSAMENEPCSCQYYLKWLIFHGYVISPGGFKYFLRSPLRMFFHF